MLVYILQYFQNTVRKEPQHKCFKGDCDGKKIAVLTRDRQGEAFRMALGMILMDDIIDVYILDRKIEDNEDNDLNIQTMNDMDMNVYTNCQDNNNLAYLTTDEIAQKLLDYDLVLPY